MKKILIFLLLIFSNYMAYSMNTFNPLHPGENFVQYSEKLPALIEQVEQALPEEAPTGKAFCIYTITAGGGHNEFHENYTQQRSEIIQKIKGAANPLMYTTTDENKLLFAVSYQKNESIMCTTSDAKYTDKWWVNKDFELQIDLKKKKDPQEEKRLKEKNSSNAGKEKSKRRLTYTDLGVAGLSIICIGGSIFLLVKGCHTLYKLKGKTLNKKKLLRGLLAAGSGLTLGTITAILTILYAHKRLTT